MNQSAVNRNLSLIKGPGIVSNPELTFLGGQTPGLNQTRVLAANYQSRLVRPADLDAFLQVQVHAF
ncbi:MAG: hypothetical protein HQK55_09975 [Deltaproteobacteria bacterium]|nr:hypothetical protein [Deltaproteobacteria bacterium]